MKKLFLRMAALDKRIDESRVFWASIITIFVIGYVHFFIIWFHHH